MEVASAGGWGRGRGRAGCKPDSVTLASRWPSICDSCCQPPSPGASTPGVQPTRRLGRAALERLRGPEGPSWSCSGWGLPCHRSHLRRGGLLHRRFTLTRSLGRSVLCGTFPRVAPGGCCPPPCPVESGLSSAPWRRGHLTGSSARSLPARRAVVPITEPGPPQTHPERPPRAIPDPRCPRTAGHLR